MKIMVKMSVVLAIMLLLTGVAFADSKGLCNCYEVTCTSVDNDATTIHHFVELCFNPGENEGFFYGICGSSGGMSLFFDAMRLQALAYSENNPYAYLKFHGDEFHVVTGIVYCYGDRWTMRGHKLDPNDPNCHR